MTNDEMVLVPRAELQQALEALESPPDYIVTMKGLSHDYQVTKDAAIAALRDRLAQPTSETLVIAGEDVRRAWEAYKSTPGYTNTRKWALSERHVDGSLWAAFDEGWHRSKQTSDRLAQTEVAAVKDSLTTEQEPPTRTPLTDYVNDADISASDMPHVVVEKLQRAIERAHGIGEKK